MSNKLGLKSQVAKVKAESLSRINYLESEIKRLKWICWCAESRLQGGLPYIKEHIPRCDVNAALDLLGRAETKCGCGKSADESGYCDDCFGG